MDVLSSMLTENTGRHFLDSGGAYGRHWERNQGRNFSAEPLAQLSFSTRELDQFDAKRGNADWWVNATLSVYHYLNDRLEYDPGMNERFLEFNERPEYKDAYWGEVVEAFLDHIGAEESYMGGRGHNTYNDDGDLLSQTIQFQVFEWEMESYCVLQIHGGCDVRGGYTDPKFFKLKVDPVNMFDNTCMDLYVPDTDFVWRLESSYIYAADTTYSDLHKVPCLVWDGPLSHEYDLKFKGIQVAIEYGDERLATLTAGLRDGTYNAPTLDVDAQAAGWQVQRRLLEEQLEEVFMEQAQEFDEVLLVRDGQGYWCDFDNPIEAGCCGV